MPISVLHLLGSAQPEGSGVARIVASLATGLEPSKYKVHAWFLGPPGPLIEDLQAAGASSRSISWRRGVYDPIGAYRFWRCLQNHNFAIVHQHYGARSIRRIVRLASDARIVVQLHGHISDPISFHRAPVAVRGADAVIAVSHSVAHQVATLTPLVVHAGVEPSKESTPENKASRETILIGAACRLIPRKGLLELIEAVALLHLEFPGLRLEIAGAGPQREVLERELVRLNLTNQVRFLNWQRDVRSVFRSWDIFAMPSLDEGLPIAALEAMAEGLPVVATSVGGLPELIEDGQTGFLVPPSDVAALANALRRLIVDSKLRRAIGYAGRKCISEKFSVSRMVGEIEAIYDSLVSGARDADRI